MATATARIPGLIDARQAYRLDEVQARLGFGRHAMTEARRKGLIVRAVGKRRFCLGSDIIAFIADAGAVEIGPAATA